MKIELNFEIPATTRKLYEKKLKKALEEYDEAAGGDQPTPRQQQYSDHGK